MIRIFTYGPWQDVLPTQIQWSLNQPLANTGFRWVQTENVKYKYEWKLQEYVQETDFETGETWWYWRDVPTYKDYYEAPKWSPTQPSADEGFRWVKTGNNEIISYEWKLQEQPKIWEKREYLIPYSNNLKLDESLDNAIVETIITSEELPLPIPPLTPVQLVDGNKVFDYIAKNTLTIMIGYHKFLQVLELIEPTEMLKGIEIEPLTITQPLIPNTTHPRLTLIDVIDKLLEVSPTTTLAKSNETLQHKFEVDPAIRDLFSDIVSPDFLFSEYMLYDALVDIGMFVDMFPRVKFGNFETNGKFMITFDDLDVKEKENFIVEGFNGYEAQQPLDNYANKVTSKVKNLSVDSVVVYPANDLGVHVNAPYGTVNITDSNAIITLPDRIKKIIKFEAYAIGPYPRYNEIMEYECIEYREWQTRTPGTPASRVPYYKYNDYHIYNLKTWHDNLPGGGSEPKPSLRRMLFKITYIPYTDTEVPEKNAGELDYTVVYNQSTNIVEHSAYSKHLKNYIKRMENGDVIISKVYKNLDKIPKLGHKVNNDFILTNLSYVKHFDRYDVTLQLSKNYTRRAEFIRAKNEIRTWEIPVDGKVEERLATFQETMIVSIGTSITGQSKHLLKPHRLFHYLPGISRNSDGIIAVINFKTIDNVTIPTMLVPYAIAFGDKLLIEFKAIDNTLLGYNKSLNWADEVRNQIGVTYTDEYGNFETLDIGFTDQFKSIIDIETFARNYPTSTINQNNNLFNTCFVKINDLNVKKDSRERFGFSYQLEIKAVNNTIVHENFLKYCFKNDLYYAIFVLDRNLSPTDNIIPPTESPISTANITSSTISTSNNVTIIEYTHDKGSNINTNGAKSIVLAITDEVIWRPILTINNPTTAQINELKQGKLKVYFN